MCTRGRCKIQSVQSSSIVTRMTLCVLLLPIAAHSSAQFELPTFVQFLVKESVPSFLEHHYKQDAWFAQDHNRADRAALAAADPWLSFKNQIHFWKICGLTLLMTLPVMSPRSRPALGRLQSFHRVPPGRIAAPPSTTKANPSSCVESTWDCQRLPLSKT